MSRNRSQDQLCQEAKGEEIGRGEEGRKGGREGEGDMVCWEGPWLVSGRMGEKKAQERRGDGRCRRLVRIPSNETEMTGDG